MQKQYPGATFCFRMASPTPKNLQNATPLSQKKISVKTVVFAIPSIQKMYPGATFCFRIASPTPTNLQKSIPQSLKNDFFENVVFAIPSMQKGYPGAVWVAFCKGWGPKYLLLATPGRDKMSSELSFGCYLHGAGSEIPACS